MVLVAKVSSSLLLKLKYLVTNGPTADRRPIDPPPIVQLRVIDPSAPSQTNTTPTQRRRNNSAATPPGSPTPSASSRHLPEAHDPDAGYGQSFLQNPYYFMFASLAKPDDDAELHWLKVKYCPLFSAYFLSKIQLNFCHACLSFTSCMSTTLILIGRSHTVHNRISGFIALPPQRPST